MQLKLASASSLLFLMLGGFPLVGSTIPYQGALCLLQPVQHAVPACVGTDLQFIPFGGQSVNLDWETTSAGGTVSSTIQGTMGLWVSVDSGVIIYTQLGIIPNPGPISFSNSMDVYVWADQPLAGSLEIMGADCSTFTQPSGNCAPMGDASVPYLGSNPDLANAAHFTLSQGDSCSICPPDGTAQSGLWQNSFRFIFIGPGIDHLQFVIQESQTFTSATLAPEPATSAEIAIGFLFLVLAGKMAQRGKGTAERPC